MNYKYALEILQLKSNYSIEELRKQYKYFARKYHPDKCKDDDATTKFILINESYQYLINNASLENTISDEETNYFIDLSLKLIHKLDENTLINIGNFINKYNFIIQLNDNTLKNLQNVLCNKEYVLNPTIDQLLNKEVFKLMHMDEVFYIPLWHNELSYQLKTHHLTVKIIPKLSNHIEIDEHNNICIYLKNSTNEKEDINFYLGKNKYTIEKNNLSDQLILFHNKGIPIIQDDIYDCLSLSNIIVHLS